MHLLIKKSLSPSTTRGHISTSLFHRSSKIPEFDSTWLVMLPPYCPFFSPVEQAHSCLKSIVKQNLVLPHIQVEIFDILNMRAEAGLNQQQWRANVLLRIGNNALQQITQQKRANWCAYSSVYPCISQSRNHSRLN